MSSPAQQALPFYLSSTFFEMSASTCTRAVLEAQLDTMWNNHDPEVVYDSIDKFKEALFAKLWPAPVAEPEAELPSEAESEKSEGSKRGRKPGSMTPEAKQAMLAKRAATLAAKAAGADPKPKPEPKARKPKAEPKPKLTKEERSEAAKARYAALSEEEKAANKARLAAGKAAAKAAKAAAV